MRTVRLDRRDFLVGSTAFASQIACSLFSPSPSPTPAPAAAPTPMPTPTPMQTARVNIVQLAQAVRQQQCEQWCWAACISMIFNFYDHPLSQAEIVAATYGTVACLPSFGSTNVGRDLSRTYIDDRGIPFASRVVSAYDYFNGINTFNNQGVVDALSRNNPLVYANTAHAMIVYSVTYLPTALGPNIVRVDVVDPWPLNPRTHVLSSPEMIPAHLGGQMTFLAQVQVT